MKIRIFISSKVNPVFEGLDEKDYTIGKLRAYLKSELEKEMFIGVKCISVILNEEGFEQDFTEDAFNACIKQVSKADIIVILYNGDAGWAPEKKLNYNGICHEEYLAAVKDHPGMTFGINISGYFKKSKYSTEQKQRNRTFQDDIDSLYRFHEYAEAKTTVELQDYILRHVRGYISQSIEQAFQAKKEVDKSNIIFGKTLDWSKLSYKERANQLKHYADKAFEGFDAFKDIIIEHNVIPDNMSVPEARNYIQRPFLYDHDLITGSKKRKGVIHIISVYGNATESQIKNLVGHPDITVIKTPFGYYLWEQTSHIQIFFLINYRNPNVIRTRMHQVEIWLKSSKELQKVQQRSLARYSILKAILDSQKISGIK